MTKLLNAAAYVRQYKDQYKDMRPGWIALAIVILILFGLFPPGTTSIQ